MSHHGVHTRFLLVSLLIGGFSCMGLVENKQKSTNVLYEENFSSQGGIWTCSKDTCTWKSENIDISEAENVTISMNARSYTLGQFENSDYLEVYYRIDNGGWVMFFDRRNDLEQVTISESFSNTGSTLRIKILAQTSARNETYEVDNISVVGDGDVAPPPPTECDDSEGCHEIEPTGTSDDADLIQDSLNSLHGGDTLLLNGDFVIGRTIYLPSRFNWVLDGSLTLGDHADLDRISFEHNGITSSRYAAITEQRGGATDIDMSGGTYYGNGANNTENKSRFIYFVNVTNSNFHDMVVRDAPDDNFTLGALSSRNVSRNILSQRAGGNGLSDKGHHNEWYDCIAEDCESDGWTPK